MVNNLDALYATPENIKFVESTTENTGETKEQLALKKKYSWLELADLIIGKKISSSYFFLKTKSKILRLDLDGPFRKKLSPEDCLFVTKS